MSEEVWVVFRGQVITEGQRPDWFNDVDQVVEVVRANKISKSYVKLTETPFYHPNVSFGDVLKVEPSKQEMNEKVAIIEFSGLEFTTEDTEGFEGLGSGKVGLDPNNLEEVLSLDKQVKPVVIDKYKQGLVYEPVQLMTHGTYKINVTFNAENDKSISDLKDYFQTYDAIFQTSWNKKYGSVGFSRETNFETAVKCLEDAPGVVGCFIAFDPREFPEIGYSEDLIPKKDEESEGF